MHATSNVQVKNTYTEFTIEALTRSEYAMAESVLDAIDSSRVIVRARPCVADDTVKLEVSIADIENFLHADRQVLWGVAWVAGSQMTRAMSRLDSKVTAELVRQLAVHVGWTPAMRALTGE